MLHVVPKIAHGISRIVGFNAKTFGTIAKTVLSPKHLFGNNAVGRNVERVLTAGLAGKAAFDTIDHGQRAAEVLGNPSSEETYSQHKYFGQSYTLAALGHLVAGALPTGPKEIVRGAMMAWNYKTAKQSQWLEAAQDTDPNSEIKQASILGNPIFERQTEFGTTQNHWMFEFTGGTKFALKDQEILSAEAIGNANGLGALNSSQRQLRYIQRNGIGENPFKFLWDGSGNNPLTSLFTIDII